MALPHTMRPVHQGEHPVVRPHHELGQESAMTVESRMRYAELARELGCRDALA